MLDYGVDIVQLISYGKFNAGLMISKIKLNLDH